MKNFKIAAIVVTYNRRELLLRCLDAIVKQEYKPSVIYVVDNASTDGTDIMLRNLVFDIPLKIIQLKENLGGAGGFNEGIKAAYEENAFDAFWVMDDDGIPERSCLNNMAPYLNTNAHIAPLVLSVENPQKLAFPYLVQKNYNEIIQIYGEKGYISNYSNPFNGILFRKDLVATIGYPKKEMFIWGDEREYVARSRKYGYPPITIINAIHLHPADRLVLYDDFLKNKQIVYVESKLRRYCFYRNSAYINKKYKSIKSHLYYFFSYTFYYLWSRRFDIQGLFFFYQASVDGLVENFSKHKSFL